MKFSVEIPTRCEFARACHGVRAKGKGRGSGGQERERDHVGNETKRKKERYQRAFPPEEDSRTRAPLIVRPRAECTLRNEIILALLWYVSDNAWKNDRLLETQFLIDVNRINTPT